jgi:ABC-type multidrug transport system fused ATPase/permease subunit
LLVSKNKYPTAEDVCKLHNWQMNSSKLDPLQIYCGSTAIQVCTTSESVSDLVTCLYDHHSKCRRNQNYLTAESTEAGNEREINVEVLLALLYFIIPIILVVWALNKMVTLQTESSEHMKLYEEALEDPEMQQPPPSIDLSFLKISFFVRVNFPSQLPQLRHLRSSRSARVLDQVTGTFRAHQMSAIMGPSGSGLSDAILPLHFLTHFHSL